MRTKKPVFFLFFLCLFLFTSLTYAKDENKSDSNNTISKLAKLTYKTKVSKDTNSTFGPVRLREKYEDWDKGLKEVDGAFISYANDRIEDTGIWQSKGALIYPISKRYQPRRDSEDWNKFVYTKLALLPTIKWNRQANTEELSFYLPIDYAISHRVRRERDSSGNLKGLAQWRDDYYFSLSYMTDFDFEGAMINVEFKYEPTVMFGERFKTGSWHGLMDNSNRESTGIVYLLRIIPGLIYSRVLSESAYIDRQEHDNIFAITTSLELRFKLFGKSSPWEVYGTYNIWYDFSGDLDGYSDILKIGSTWWLNDNVGLSLKYEKGDTPLTNKEIDLVTLNLQLRL